ncbi:alpha/beta fold hydrolase [Akkermansiaceae bacterium]|nr:alpha/beta fold hydrolase [Akkermansiaceae bacterium]
MLRQKLSRLNATRPPMPWHKPRIKTSEGNTETVILIHGLWRSVWAMEPMAKFLHSEGYNTVNLAYSSLTKPMDYIVENIGKEVASYLEKGPVHIVTHSLGGIITREILPNLSHDNLGRIVMLAPPNQGSEIIDWLAKHSAPRCTLGPVGLNLGADQITAPSIPENIETSVIMGNRSLIPFFQKLMPEANDGIVSVERGKVEGMNEFHVLDADHTFIASEPKVMDMTLEFLRR